MTADPTPIRTSTDCRDCKHFRSTMVFELCSHKESQYIAGGKKGEHTIGHMRRHGCGPEARWYEPKDRSL